MKRWPKRSVVGLVSIAAATLIVLGQLGERKMQRRIDVAVAPVALRSDADSVARGRHLFMSRSCTECHGVDGAGKTFIEDANGMRVHAPNITPGEGSAVKAYTADDWTRTVRHGVKPDGRPAIVKDAAEHIDHILPPPAWPAAANLTPGEGSAMTRYDSVEAFATMFCTGKRPDGQAVSSVMPFLALEEINDTDVRALYLHLKSLAPKPAGGR